MKHDSGIIKVLLVILVICCYHDSVRLYVTGVSADDSPMHRIKRAALASDVNVTLETVGEWENVTDIRISDKVLFNLTITVPIGSYQMTSSVNTSEVMSVCSMSVVHVGSNFVGIQASDFSPTFNHTTTNGTQIYNNFHANIDFGTIQNDGSNPNDTESDIVVQFDVIIINSTFFTDGFIYLVSANVTIDTYTESSMLSFTGIEQSLFSMIPPIANVSSPGPVDIGDIANWTVTLDLRDAVNKIEIDAWVNGTYEYPVCSISVGEIGPAFACFERVSGQLNKINDSIVFEIPTIINTEFYRNDTFVNDTILEILVLTRIPSYVTMSDSLFLNIDVYLDDKLVFPMSEPIATTSNTLPSPNSAPQVLIGTVASVNTVSLGSAIVFIIDVVTPPGSVTIYDVTISTDPGVVTICDIQLMNIGDYLCMDKVVNATYISTTSNIYFDTADVPIGSVPNLNGDADSSDDGNKFQLEVAVCAPDFSSAAVGDTLTMTVDLYYDPVSTNQKVTDTLTYNIASSTDPLLATGNVTFHNESIVLGYIGQRLEVNVTAVIEQTTDHFILNISVPVIGDCSLAFLEMVTLTRVGSELLCMENRTLTPLSNETVSYTQTVRLVYDLGPVSHIGMAERHPFVQYNSSGENELEFTITLLIADHVNNIQGALLPITVTLEGAAGLTAEGVAYIEVQTTGIEVPELVFIFTMEQFNYTEKISGDNFTCYVELYLDENSTAHAHNVLVHVMSPYYVGFGSLFDVHDANVTHISNLPEPGMSISVSEIDFKDNVSFAFSLILDPARLLPMGIENFETVLVVDMTWRGAQRPDRTDTGVLYTEPDVLEFGFNTELPGAIGMESGIIQACQITASSHLDTNKPEDARLNTGVGWKPLVRGTPFCEEYLKINIGTPAYISDLQVQSTTDNYQDIVTSFSLQYSNDDVVWYDVTEMDGISAKAFHINVTSGGSVSDVYDVPLTETERFTAQYVRLVSASCQTGLRLELMGLKQSGPAVDCATVQTNTDTILEQSYVVDDVTGQIFVCGLQGVDQDVVCSLSDDNGESWIEIDENIVNIVALVSNTSLVIGKADDNVTLLVSEDRAATWDTLTEEYFTEIQGMAGYTVSKDFPYDDYRGQSPNNMYTTHGMDGPNSMSITGTMSGISVTDGGSWSDAAWWGTEDWALL